MKYEEFVAFIEKHHKDITHFIGDEDRHKVESIYKDLTGWRIKYLNTEQEFDAYDDFDVHISEVFDAYDDIAFEMKIKKSKWFKISCALHEEDIEYVKNALKTLSDLNFDKGNTSEAHIISNLLELIEDNIVKVV